MTIKFYYSSTAASVEINGRQKRIEGILVAKKIEFEKIDISASEEDKNKMRELMGDPKAIAPQLFNDDQYCGAYEAFDNANEDGKVKEFLKLE